LAYCTVRLAEIAKRHKMSEDVLRRLEAGEAVTHEFEEAFAIGELGFRVEGKIVLSVCEGEVTVIDKNHIRK